jgi:S-layer homology domain
MHFRSSFCFGLALSLSLSLLTPLSVSVVSAQTPVPAQSPAPTPAAPAARTLFKDVPADYWAHEYIEGLARFNVISGFPDGTFKPNEPVTRAQFAAILENAFLSEQPFEVPYRRASLTQPPEANFTDVPNNHWASRYIFTARLAGFLSGYPGNQFKPNEPISRVQALVSIANGLGYRGGAIAGIFTYKDAAAIPEYARPGLAAARAAGIVVNYPALDQLMPNRPATRAEVAAFVYQALVKDGRAQPVAGAGARWNKTPIATLPTAAEVFSFSADGQRLLAQTPDGAKLQIWNTQTGALIKEIAASDGNRFYASAISKDGTKVAAMAKPAQGLALPSPRNTVELAAWTIETGQTLWRKTISDSGLLTGHIQIAFSPNNQQITTLINLARVEGDVRRDPGAKFDLWDTVNGEAVQSLTLNEDVRVNEFAISPDGQFLAILYDSAPFNTVDIWRRNQSGLFEDAKTLPSPEHQRPPLWDSTWNIAFTNDGLLGVLTRSPYDGGLIT